MIRLALLFIMLGCSSLVLADATVCKKRLEGKVALVTGAGQGIGKETAIFLAREGAQVIVSDVNDREGQLVVEEIGESSFYVHLDVRSESDWQTAMHIILKEFSQLDVLVNNAAISGLQVNATQDPEHTLVEGWRELQAVNVEGVLLGCKYAIPVMKTTTKSSSIINIASVAGIIGFPGNPLYAAAKAAVINFTKSVALYCCQEGYNIRCNAILPGFILTPLLVEGQSQDKQERENQMNALARIVPMGKIGMPEDIANAVVFLASDESKYITGLELVIDGGIMSWSGLPLRKKGS